MVNELMCDNEALYRLEKEGGIVLEFLAIAVLFYSIVVLIDKFLMGKC